MWTGAPLFPPREFITGRCADNVASGDGEEDEVVVVVSLAAATALAGLVIDDDGELPRPPAA